MVVGYLRQVWEFEVVEVHGEPFLDLLLDVLVDDGIALSAARRSEYDRRTERVHDVDPPLVPLLAVVEARGQVHRVFVGQEARLLLERFVLGVEYVVHQIVFQQTRHPYSAHEQADISDRYGQYVERRVGHRRKRQLQQPPVEEKQHAAYGQRRDDFPPRDLFLFHARRSQTRKGEKYDGEQFSPSRCGLPRIKCSMPA